MSHALASFHQRATRACHGSHQHKLLHFGLSLAPHLCSRNALQRSSCLPTVKMRKAFRFSFKACKPTSFYNDLCTGALCSNPTRSTWAALTQNAPQINKSFLHTLEATKVPDRSEESQVESNKTDAVITPTSDGKSSSEAKVCLAAILRFYQYTKCAAGIQASPPRN